TPCSRSPRASYNTLVPFVTLVWQTHKFEHVPVEYVVIGEALSVEQIPEELTKRAAKIQVGGELGSKLGQQTELLVKGIEDKQHNER
uniref:Uncharacterized protein n=1 Tax=Oncorhynchus mykiss TaxID=8022 RepID=A0A8K9Y011_ONCMY